MLLSVWWDCGGIIYFELLKPREIVTADLSIIRFHKELLIKQSARSTKRDHAARLTQEKMDWEVLPILPTFIYSDS